MAEECVVQCDLCAEVLANFDDRHFPRPLPDDQPLLGELVSQLLVGQWKHRSDRLRAPQPETEFMRETVFFKGRLAGFWQLFGLRLVQSV